MPVQRRTISAAEFKARCLELMEVVRDTRAEWVITKHGTPVARLVPVADSASGPAGFLRGTVRAGDGLLSSASQLSRTPASSARHKRGRKRKSE